MAEYIDIDTPLELKVVWGNTFKPYTSTLRELLDTNHIPYTAANVRSVAWGRNIYDTVNEHCEFKCSVCGVELSSVCGGDNDFGLDGGYFNYCPNCGAMMEES